MQNPSLLGVLPQPCPLAALPPRAGAIFFALQKIKLVNVILKILPSVVVSKGSRNRWLMEKVMFNLNFVLD
jgi:hypothetical protein